MKYSIHFFSLVFLLLNVTCSRSVQINNIEKAPAVQQQDKALADVYKPLDGRWKGRFLVMEDPQPAPLGNTKLTNLTKEQATDPRFKIAHEIEVEQIYTSESPFFQRVQITDYYPASGKKEVSKGVNKIQDGKMWCVVHKPNEVVIHEGSTQEPSTIIWQSKQKSPLKIEYFQEAVSEKFYEIIGYGYYQNDDPKRQPKYWFYGKYERQ
ncbi:MAG: hypothetical protein AAF990_01680 [Bacteroidota bacterium]